MWNSNYWADYSEIGEPCCQIAPNQSLIPRQKAQRVSVKAVPSENAYRHSVAFYCVLLQLLDSSKSKLKPTTRFSHQLSLKVRVCNLIPVNSDSVWGNLKFSLLSVSTEICEPCGQNAPKQSDSWRKRWQIPCRGRPVHNCVWTRCCVLLLTVASLGLF